MRPLVSVIVPMWNSRASVGAAIASLQAQTIDDWRAIVIDDGSTDGGAEVVAALARDDDRISLHAQSNSGLGAARNAGLRLASGEFVLFLDADDTLTPIALEQLTATARAAAGASFGAFAWVEPGAGAEPFEVSPSCRVAGLNELLERNRFPAHAQIIARELLRDVEFGESLRSAEDWDLWLRLAARGASWAATDHVVAHYHLTPSSMSRDDARMANSLRLVARTAFTEARLAGASAVDASPQRERAVCGRMSLECATAAALADPSTRAAQSILARHGFIPGELSPESAATTAYWMIPFAARRTPAAWSELNPRWLQALSRLWDHMEHSHAAPAGFSAQAQHLLPARLVDATAVARELCRRASGAQCIEVLGFGRNGRRLARQLLQSGTPFTIRDDALAGQRVAIDGHAMTVAPMNGPLPVGAVVLVTPDHDAPIISRLDRAGLILRWSDVRNDLARPLRRDIADRWPPSAREQAA